MQKICRKRYQTEYEKGGGGPGEEVWGRVQWFLKLKLDTLDVAPNWIKTTKFQNLAF